MGVVWKVEKCESVAETGYINKVYWKAQLRDGDYLATEYGARMFDEGSPKLPYDQVTEQDILEWVWADESVATPSISIKEQIETALIERIEEAKQPKINVGLPWAQLGSAE